MTRAVFLDFYNTICYFEPSREVRQQACCRAFGIEVSLEALRRAYVYAETYWTLENAKESIGRRSPDARITFYCDYERRLLAWPGLEVTPEQARQVYQCYRNSASRLRLFDDVLPLLRGLRERGLIAGIISNTDREIAPLCEGLGLDGHVQVRLGSFEVGAEKPDPAIFREALRLASVNPNEAVHVGDQYHSDVVGARGVGITPLLLDRYSVCGQHTDCERIQDLSQVLDHLCT